MIQAIGLTSSPRKELPPAVDDVSFEAYAGRVTALLGAPGAGKTTALKLMLELQRGRGVAYFRGRPLHRIPHPAHEVGVLLGDVPGHPARSVRGHLRMLCAASGVPARRADEVLEAVGLVSLRDERLGTLSRGMDRRLGLACALLTDPHTLVLDDPARGLSVGESRWLHDMMREHAGQGGTVLCSTADPKEAARIADQVVTLEGGRVVADQEAADFARTRLRPRVAVRSPHAVRLSALLTQEARAARRSVEVVREGGNRLCVYGSTCAEVGETAFRHGIVVHQLADEIGDMGPAAGAATEGRLTRPLGDPQKGRRPPLTPAAEPAAPDAAPPEATADEAETHTTAAPQRTTSHPAARATRPRVTLPPPVLVRPAPRPLRPVRYEIRRATGVATGYVVGACVLLVSALTAVVLARIGHTPQPRLLAAWPAELPLPPAALGAGLLGALAFGDEFRHPALAADRGTVPRRLGLLTAKLLVASAAALVLAVLTIGCDAELLYLVYGSEMVTVPADWLPLTAGWLALVTGCAWAGVLAAGVFRSTTAGLAAVVAVPLLVVPLVHKLMEGPSAPPEPLSQRLRDGLPLRWPFGGEQHLEAVLRLVAQPVGGAMTLSVVALLGAYVFTGLRSRVR
ncbi:MULTISPECIES: ABC transporter ATP-binding protein [Streptomyces]|uniref:ABC transporter ATP-binding protein n=1 Tax=Streptomyces tendae TaxID=1932 RepID=A0ABX5ZQS8_STRTE|nr:ABC transporter ATP-binding protein [Streptomyces tendae]QER85851.1 ABC transporter ATP-binding protein [Streptomyces tendae]